jgi:hypothetical protein
MLITAVEVGLPRMDAIAVVQHAVHSPNDAFEAVLVPLCWQRDWNELLQHLVKVIDEGMDCCRGERLPIQRGQVSHDMR